MKPTAATISHSGKAVDWLVSSVRSPTTAWIAPVVPQKKPTATDKHKLGLLWKLTLTEQNIRIRLSRMNVKLCACHFPIMMHDDGQAACLGSYQEVHPRSTAPDTHESGAAL